MYAMAWKVVYQPKKVGKQALRLPKPAHAKLIRLIGELAVLGPERADWKNFGRLRRQPGQRSDEVRYHCHLSSGKQCAVACWKVYNNTITIEVYYVGSHQNAPY